MTPAVLAHAQSVFPGDAPAHALRLRGSYEVGRYVGANFCLIFGDETQQAGEIAKVNQYFMPLVILGIFLSRSSITQLRYQYMMHDKCLSGHFIKIYEWCHSINYIPVLIGHIA